jgi:UDP-galactopyranose mutase
MIPDKKYQTLIIGTGAAELVSVIELYKVDKDIDIIEKSCGIGGSPKTCTLIDRGLEFRTNYGTHISSHHKNRFLLQFIDKNPLVQIKPHERVFINGKFLISLVKPSQLFKNYALTALHRRENITNKEKL